MAASSSHLRLGYFGRAGSFSHVAAARRFPKANLSESPTVEEAFARLQAGEFSHILVPIENASSGIITNTADQLMRLAKTDAGLTLQIREALAMRIKLILMSRPDSKIITKSIRIAPPSITAASGCKNITRRPSRSSLRAPLKRQFPQQRKQARRPSRGCKP